jgi:hypothetical protein
MPIPVGSIADFLIQAAAQAGIEFSAGPLANATTRVGQVVYNQLGIKISEKMAERIVVAEATVSGIVVGKVLDELPLEEIGRETRRALGSGASKLGSLTNEQLGALVARSMRLDSQTGRTCAYCGERLPADAHVNRRYCNSSCRSKAAYRRRA